MRGPAGRCPNCGAPVRFRWSSAVQTTCEACRSVIVRHDVDLETIGEVADLPPDSSPIQLGTEGALDGRAFTVIGRIVYEYADGGWNEWHLAYADGTSGWLSDAQLEYAVSSHVAPTRPLPFTTGLRVGLGYSWGDVPLQVSTITTARYKGVEGELPFEFWGKDQLTFADLRGHDATFGTIDYSGATPLLFIGRFVSFDELHLRNLRTFDDEDRSRGMRGFNCANCGAAVELRALAHTRAVACTSCGAVLDARDRNVTILQSAEARQSIVPLIPLGTRGTWHGQPYDVIGFQQRSVTVDGARYAWDEYVLFNRYHGFRYLTNYNGHWNDVDVVRELPTVTSTGSRPTMSRGNVEFKHFQHAVARTDFVLGEFPWRVKVGETVVTDDYVAPPLLLSSEGTTGERTWSLGTYTEPAAIASAFVPSLSLPRPVGVFANQPNPWTAKSRALWRTWRWLAVLILALFVYRQMMSAEATILEQSYTYTPGAAEASFVTPPFTIVKSGTVDISIEAHLQNSWVGYDIALIDLGSGTAYNVATEVSYYFGEDQGERWTEGSTRADRLLPKLPAGQYYLRVEPEGPVNGPVVPYTIRIRRDVPLMFPYVLAFLAITIRPVWVALRRLGFEVTRDAESDYGSSGDDDDDDDDD